tara:strand:+ start:395 stop:511 length:117 start_codon:yes stop_codon:yes gene_type:complete
MANLIIQELIEITHVEITSMAKFSDQLQPKNRDQKRSK